MKCTTGWSYDRYRPAVHGGDEIYIQQILPGTDRITLAFSGGRGETSAYIRMVGSDAEWQKGEVSGNTACFEGLTDGQDYEFYLENDGGKSATGLARPGFVPGTVVNYLHPEDHKYEFSGQHLCTPSLMKHPDGYLLASMDVFDGNTPQNLTLIFRSDDDGKSWYHYTELFPCFWGMLFWHRGAVYMLATSTEYGDLLIGKSEDGGKTFCTPTVLARGSSHKIQPGWHKSGMPVVEHKGRLWTGIDYGSHKSGGHASCLLSVPADADLLDSSAWRITEPLRYNPHWEGAVVGDDRGFIEGNAVVMPDGGICDFLRYSTNKGEPQYGLAAVLRGDYDDPEKPLSFYKFVPFPGNLSKFDVRRDEKTGVYFSIISRIYSEECVAARNVLSLICSWDLEHWTVLCDLLDYAHLDPKLVGFQYVSFLFDGEDILYLSRTAFNGAQSFHDNNYITFHRIENFRSLIPDPSGNDLKK